MTDRETGGAPEAPEANAASEAEETSQVGQAGQAGQVHGADEEPWPFFRYPREYPRSGPSAREATREDRIAGHVQRHKARGVQPPRRDRGLSREEIVSAAIAVADAEGPDAISMRRIARGAGAGVVS